MGKYWNKSKLDLSTILFYFNVFTLNRAIKSVYRVNSIIEGFESYTIPMLEKLVYKRRFLAFAQIKYVGDKRQQKMRNLRSVALNNLLGSLDQSMTIQKKIFFETWKDECELYQQKTEEKLEKASIITLRKFFQSIYFV